MKLGIYGISSQTGKAFLVDFLKDKYHVIGYARPTEQGVATVNDIQKTGGVHLFRDENKNQEESRLVPLNKNIVTNDLKVLTDNADFIIVAVPSHFHEDVAKELKQYLAEKKTPILLSPSRTIATPFLWEILGINYPIVCFSTSPYSCKSYSANSVYIKRRKRTWLASLEGKFLSEDVLFLRQLFPQVTFTTIPALTSLNNIGAIFHPTAYLLNVDEIQERKKTGKEFSFYMEGIAGNKKVAEMIERIDQNRLQIAHHLGLPTFGLKENPREEIWRKITNALRALEEEQENDIELLRQVRGKFLGYINSCVISAQHWLDITYGVIRIPSESLGEAVGRTPTYQKNSVPQKRYIDEDIPTGLVPLEDLCKLFDIPHDDITRVIDLYDQLNSDTIRNKGRSLTRLKELEVIEFLKGIKDER